MFTKKSVGSLVFLILGCSISSVTFSALNTPLLFGSVAQDTPGVMYQRLSPLTQYLSSTLKRPVNLILSPNMGDAINKVATNEVDITYLTPVAYIHAHEKSNSQIIAKMVTNNKSSFQLMIVVRKDSSIKSVSDLIGKKFAFGDKKALLQRATVVGAGVKLEEFSSYKFIGHYNNIARGVAQGIYDAGILKDTKALKWEKKNLRILYRSPHMPPYNLTVSSKLSKSTIKKIQQAFLQLDISNPKHHSVIKALDNKYDGFAATSDKEYDVIRKLIKPFSK